MIREGFILTPLQKRALLVKEADGSVNFAAQSIDELEENEEWRTLSDQFKKAVVDMLWMPAHCHELSFNTITSNPVLLEELYQIILEAIIDGKIRFKEGSKSIRAGQLAREGRKKEQHQHFLEIVKKLNRQYTHFRKLALKKRFLGEVSKHAPGIPGLIDGFSLPVLEVIQAEEHPDYKEIAITNVCKSLMIDRISDSLTAVSSKNRDKKVQTSPEKSGLFQFRQALGGLPVGLLARILKEENIKKRQELTTFLLRRHLFQSLPSELQDFLGPKTMQLLSPGQLHVVLRVIEEEKGQVASDNTISTPISPAPLSVKIRQLFIRKKQSHLQPQPKEHSRQSGVVVMVKAIGAHILPQLSPKKLALVFASNNADMVHKLAAGFNRFLPHIKTQKIIPLSRFFATPLWEIVRSLRFINNINQELLEQLESMVNKDLLDIPFAKLLADTFKHKLVKLKVFHLEEVEKNSDVIRFFKEAFLSLKKGVVRLARLHFNLIRNNKELIPILFEWKSSKLNMLFSNQVYLRKFLIEIGRPETRKIIFEGDH